MNAIPSFPPESAPRVALMTGPFGDVERAFTLDRPMTVAEIIAAYELTFTLPTIAVIAVAGEATPVLRGAWNVRMVGEGATLAFIAVPGGGGSDGGGKQVVGVIAALALSIAAPFVGGAVAGALGFTAGSTTFAIAKAVGTVAFLAGGSLLLNTIFPTPKAPDQGAADPVYTANAASNPFTPLGIVPVQYGTMRAPPPFASRPYSEFAGNDQILYQLFLVSAGKVNVKRIEIGNTTAWLASGGYTSSFTDLEFEIVQPGEAITLFPANVVTAVEVAGQELPDPPDVSGPFVVNSAGTTIDRIAVDFAFPFGLYQQGSQGKIKERLASLKAEYREVDDNGDPVGSWTTLFEETFTNKTRTPQRISRAADVTAGRYEVRFYRETAAGDPENNEFDQVNWVGLRGYLTDFVTPPNCTLLAMKIRANEQLSQAAASQIFVTGTRCLPVHDGMSWSAPVETEAIAWAAADILRDSDYGFGYADTVYDLAKLTSLDATWSGRGDVFNAIFDRKWTGQDALAAVLRAGRAFAVRVGGQLGFDRHESKSIRRATFTPEKIVRGTFSHKFVLFDEEKPDHIVVKYLDRGVWTEREVVCSLGAFGEEEPQERSYFGIIDHDQNWREGVTEAAMNAYQREFCSFTTEWEGKLLTRGSPVMVLHPFIQGVAEAALADRNGDTLTVDRDLDHVSGTAYVILVDKRGKEWGPCLVASQPSGSRIIVLDSADRASVEAQQGTLDDLLPGEREEPATVMLCEGELRPFNGLVVSAIPAGADRVNVLTVIDAPEVYLADQTETIPPAWTVPTLPPIVPVAPIVQNLAAVVRVAVAGTEVEAMWQPAAGAQSYVAEVSYDDGDSWSPIWSGTTNRFTAPCLPQAFTLRVAAVGTLQGPWTTANITAGDIPQNLLGEGVVGEAAITPQVNALLDQLRIQADASVAKALDSVRELQELMAAQTGGSWAIIDKALNQVVITVGQAVESNTATVTVLQQAVATIENAFAQFFVGLTVQNAQGQGEALWQMLGTAGPEGVGIRIAMLARASLADALAEAGFYMEAGVVALGGGSRIALDADKLALIIGGITTDAALLIQQNVPREVPIINGEIQVDLSSREASFITYVDQNCTVLSPVGGWAGYAYSHAFQMVDGGGWTVGHSTDHFGSAPVIDQQADAETVVEYRKREGDSFIGRVWASAIQNPSFAFIGSNVVYNNNSSSPGNGDTSPSIVPVGGTPDHRHPNCDPGDVLVVANFTRYSAGGGRSLLSTPANWALMHHANNGTGTGALRFAVFRKRIDGSETSAVKFFGDTSAGSTGVTLRWFRFRGGFLLSHGIWNSQITGGDPGEQTVLLEGVVAEPVITFGFSLHQGSSPPALSFSPTADQSYADGSDGEHKSAFRIDNATVQNTMVDTGDGSSNTGLFSGHIKG